MKRSVSHRTLATFNDKYMEELRIIGKPTIYGDLDFLDRFSFTNGRKFPTSYQKFVKKFGYGRVLGEWFIYIPMGDYGDSWNIRSEEIRSTYYDDVIQGELWFDLEPDGTIEIIKQLVPFAQSENGYYLFWNIVSQPIINEFDIYITDFRGLGVRKAATSIDELIDKMIDKNRFNEIIPLFCQEPYSPIFECIEELH